MMASAGLMATAWTRISTSVGVSSGTEVSDTEKLAPLEGMRAALLTCVADMVMDMEALRKAIVTRYSSGNEL